MTTRAVRVLLADDHTLVRAGIRRILESQPGIEVLAEAADGAGVLDLVQTHDADVLVLDLKMPGLDGIDVLRAVKAAHPAVKVVVVTMFEAREYVARAMRHGADAYLLKDSAVQDLVAAIDAVTAGSSYFSPAIQVQMAELLRGEAAAPSGAQLLTNREREVLAWLARGLSSKEVAAQLDISVRTVETHRANLMQKLGVKSVALLIQVALREGLLDPPASP
ncbi:response regulator transcription factor [Luteitalea sp.]|uniref:response regulator n=1 Tax=Luteitalea sp. TaxID=2004800 RepID=UPI0025B9CB3B|nr:response regulator transcription factor [Luteitalea sp.]